MHILDKKKDEKIDHLIIYLTKEEAKETVDSILDLLKSQEKHHVHVSSQDYQKEITYIIYDTQDINNYDERTKKLILEDK